MKRLLEAGAAIDKKDKVRTVGFNSNCHSLINPQRQFNGSVCVSAGGHSRPLGLQRRQPARPAAPPRPGSQDHLQRQGRSSQTKTHERDAYFLFLYVQLLANHVYRPDVLMSNVCKMLKDAAFSSVSN